MTDKSAGVVSDGIKIGEGQIDWPVIAVQG